MGFTLGVLFRNSAAAIVGYFVYAMVLPTLSGLLAGAQDWYRDAQPWVDFQWNQTGLFDGGLRPRTGPSSPSPAPSGCSSPSPSGSGGCCGPR